ncbi:MAG TPA: hypothetical protein VFQ35_17005, partial [Polyangiaceae bacterium]|nr:hypothetical protein [Polyangiaceae bacterium]
MRAIFAFACGFGVIVGCGRAENDGAKGSGGNSAALGGAASGGATSGAGQSGEATFGGHIGSGGSSVANAGGGIVASGGNGGATAGAAENPCGAGDFFLKIDGDLPGGFGANQRLSLGCPDARPGVFAVPVSFTRPPPEGGGIEVGIV